MEAILTFCEKNELLLEKPVFQKKGVSGNAFVCYQCSCGKSAQSLASNFLEKTVYACKDCNAGLINKIYKPVATQDLVARIESKSFKVLKHTHATDLSSSSWTLQCSKGHEFVRAGNKIQKISANSCPKCWNPSLEEAWARCLIEIHFKAPFPNTRPEWLISSKTGHVLELDMYNTDLKLAFEYHGAQHFRAIFGEKRFSISQRNDQARREACLKENVHLIELVQDKKTLNAIAFFRKIAAQLTQHGINISEDTIKEACAATQHLTVNGADDISKKIKKILDDNNMTWLSGTYINSQSVLHVRNNCCGAEAARLVGSIRNLATVSRLQCAACYDLGAVRKSNAIERHTSMSQLMCKQEGWTFKHLRFNPSGHCTGFAFVDHQRVERILGIKRYKKFIEENNLFVAKNSEPPTGPDMA